MCIYVTYIYIYMCIYIYKYIYIYLYICIHIYIYKYVHIYIYVHTHSHTDTSTCIHTYTHVATVRVRNTSGAESDIAGTRPTHARPPAMYIHEIICMYMHVHIYTYIHSCVHAHVHISRLFGCETHTSHTRHQTLCRHQLMLTATNTSTRPTRLPSFYVYVHTRVYMYGHTCIHIHI